MKKKSYRTTTPFSGGLSPTSPKSRQAPLFGDTPLVQDILNGELGKVQDIHGRGNWGKGEDVSKSYMEKGDEFRIDMRIQEVLDKMQDAEDRNETWVVKTLDGKELEFPSYDSALTEMQKKKKPYSSISRKFAAVTSHVIPESLESCGTINSTHADGGELGSCFYIGDNMWITCAHCVRSYDRASMPDKSYFSGSVLTVGREGSEEKATLLTIVPEYDVAVLRGPRAGTSLLLDDNTDATVGTPVVAIGNPKGYENNVSEGIVSGIDRKVYYDVGAPDYVFTDAQVLPGSSGGPLISLESGRVIGMMCVIIPAEGLYGLNAALPSKFLRTVINGIK